MEKQEVLNELNKICNSIKEFNYKCRRYGIGHNYYKDCSKKLKNQIKKFLILLEKRFSPQIDILEQIKDKLKKYSETTSIQIKQGKELINFIEDKLIELEFELDDNPNLENNGGLIVQHVSGRKGWTDRNNKLPEFFSKLQGEIIIVEPYYGMGTLHVLENFNSEQKIKFLTAKFGSNENPEKFRKELKRFKREFKKIELRIYPKFYEFHDRYILSKNYFVWIGHGIKDYGDKESFLIAVPIKKVLDIAKEIKEQFNERWKKADNLT